MKITSLALFFLSCLVTSVMGQVRGKTTRKLEQFFELEMPEMPDPPPGNSCGPAKRAQVTVVGGGLGGIYAASLLKLRGISYHLITASSQWGGRLRSFDSPFDSTSINDLVMEEGAQFMYGKVFPTAPFRENPIYRLFTNGELDIYDYRDEDWDAYEADGTPIDETLVDNLITNFTTQALPCLDDSGNEWFREFNLGLSPSPDESAKEILENCDNPWTNDTPLETAISHYFGGEVENALPLDEVSRAAFPEDSFDVFGLDLFIQTGGGVEGSSRVVQDLVDRNLDADRIQLEARVISVDYANSQQGDELSETPGQTATTVAEVGGCLQEYESDFVIMAVPINILRGFRNDNVINFSPPLENMDTFPIELNEVEKVWIQFDTTFWNNNDWVIVANELDSGASTVFFNYNQVFPGSNLLLTFVQESQREDMGGTINVTTVIQDLPGFIPGTTPYTSYVTDWKGDPNIDGAWEIWKLNGTYPEFFEGTRPQENLHKAGAAMCTNFWGFTWGAMISGLWSAEWVADRIANPSADPLSLEPYSPCFDRGTITNQDMRNFYDAYGSLFLPPP